MQSHRVVPAFDKGEAGDLRLGLRRKAATFQQLAFEGREEALAHRIVVGVADRSHRRPHTGFLATFAECQRRILAALVAVMDDAVRPSLADRHFQRIQHQLGAQMIGHRPPTTLRLQASSTTARYRKPLAVDTKVMSATQSWFGREAMKFRSTRSGAGLASLSRRVVVTPERRRLAPASPGARISRAMRLRPCLSPSALSAACTRGAPYVSRELAWTVRICFSRAVSAMACAEGGRHRHA